MSIRPSSAPHTQATTHLQHLNDNQKMSSITKIVFKIIGFAILFFGGLYVALTTGSSDVFQIMTNFYSSLGKSTLLLQV